MAAAAKAMRTLGSGQVLKVLAAGRARSATPRPEGHR
jgi:hypothetical protein